MATDFDLLPVYDPILRESSGKITNQLNDVWVGSLSTLMDTLISYIGQFGFKIPNLTTDEINQINSPINAQLVYNITIDAPQFYQSSTGSWRTISFT